MPACALLIAGCRALTNPSSPATPATAEIRGRFVDVDGRAWADVPLTLSSRAVAESRAESNRFETIEARSDAQGRFALVVDANRDLFALESKQPGTCATSWYWNRLEAGRTVELGDVLLEQGGVVRGRLIDERGEPALGRRTVFVSTFRHVENRKTTAARTNPETGEFVIENVPAGRASILAMTDGQPTASHGPTVDVRAGETTEIDLRVSGKAGAGIVVSVYSNWFHDGDEDALRVTLVRDSERRAAVSLGRLLHQYVFEDVPPGKYTVEIEHPRHLKWTREGVVPGSPVHAHLIPNAGIALTVLDDETGAELRKHKVTLETPSSSGRPRLMLLTPSKSTTEAVLYPVPSGDHRLKVEVAGLLWSAVPLTGLLEYETRDVVVRLKRGDWVGISDSPSAANGSGAPPTGEAEGAGLASSTKEAWLVGTLRFPCEIPASGLWVRATPVTIADVERRRKSNETEDIVRPLGSAPPRPTAPSADRAHHVQPDGSFRLGPYPPGFVRVELQLPGMDWTSSIRGGISCGSRIVLGDVELAGGAEAVRDFVLPVDPPGRLRVNVNHDCGNAEDLIVELHGTRQGCPAALARVNARGIAVTEPMLAGEYAVLVRPIDSGWVHVVSEPVSIQCGTVAELDVNVQLFPGALRVLEQGTSAPFANMQLVLEPVHGKGRGRAVFRTDSKGTIQGSMTPGDYRARLMDRAGHSQSEEVIHWSRTGPTPAEIVMPRPTR